MLGEITVRHRGRSNLDEIYGKQLEFIPAASRSSVLRLSRRHTPSAIPGDSALLKGTAMKLGPFTILAATPGWSFTPRDRDCLPKNFPAEEPGIPWFLDAYYFGDLPSNTSLPDHIDAAMRALSLEPS
ncbi:Guanylate cyclase soluble subunit alpha-3 [Portunus trituberculatus]|uniref:Guanylate cyclase soluble subunit alpha-3 n=1 Tax=Portunus trituberculatus TaxID=210409 RepID=A0A5B7JXV1_PORTR|nr:Guanylate cyclase soluble subunit alpha-3 [Portunus trituberculatus]